MKAFFYIVAFTLFLLTSCKTSSRSSIKNIVEAQRNIMPPDSIIQKQKKGVDIFATGNDPVAWSLEIDFDKMVSFKAADGTTLNVLPAFEKKALTGDAELYVLITDLGRVEIKVFNSSCSDIKSMEQFNRKTEVNIQSKLYSGCGKYLFDHRLNDIWVLESVNNKILSAPDFAKGLPRMEFNLQANKMSGSDGCNNIISSIEIKGDRIKFSAFAGTKMACANNSVEKIFNELLSNKLVDYYLENNKLILYLEDDSKLNFIRKQL